jgi:hypothetical protein
VGYPPLVTPFSQYTKNIALMNLLTMEQGKGRYAMMDDAIWGMILGKSGKVPGTIAPELIKLAEKQKGVKLEPGSFNVLKEGKFESGAQVAFNVNGNMKYGTVVQVSGDKVLISAFASHLECTTKDNCKLLPFKEKFKVGDKVSAIDVSSYKPGYTVVNVDKEHGHLWVKNDDNGKTYVYSLFGVMK